LKLKTIILKKKRQKKITKKIKKFLFKNNYFNFKVYISNIKLNKKITVINDPGGKKKFH
jgi:hypothetical protein